MATDQEQEQAHERLREYARRDRLYVGRQDADTGYVDNHTVDPDVATVYYGMVDAAKLIAGAIVLHPIIENVCNVLWMVFRGQ